jgi:uncharacterized repeat protein (TIGR01451 family)
MGTRWAHATLVVAGTLLVTAAAPAAEAQVVAPANVTATKSVSGTFEEGKTATYTVTLHNGGGVASADNPGDELVDVLPAQLTLVSAAATSGLATADVVLNQVTWNGAITVGTDVIITITATIEQGTEGDDLLNQAEVHFDADGNATNEATVQSDGDAVTAGEQATVLHVAAIAPTVTIEQALTQPDPAAGEPVLFSVEFSEPVTGFDAADVNLAGTAGATTPAVTGSGADYTISVTGAAGPGTVIATVLAGAAADDDGIASLASSSLDNQVTLTAIGPLPTTTTSSSSTTSTSVVLGTTSTTAVVGGSALPRTGSDEDGPLVAFLGYWLALGGVAVVAAAGWQRRRARSTGS